MEKGRKIDELKIFRFFYCNARSLKNKLSELKLILSEEIYELIFFTESWLNPKIMSEKLTENTNYILIRQDRNCRGGGVCCFLKNNIIFNDLKSGSFEGIDHLSFSIPNKKQTSKTFFSCIYMPPSKTNPETVETHLCDLLSDICSANSKQFIVGDFNMPRLNWGSDDDNFVNFTKSLPLTQVINFNTRKDNLIDLLLVSDPTDIQSIEKNEPFGNSDHFSFHGAIKIRTPQTKKNPVNVIRDFVKGDYIGLNHYLFNIDWKLAFKNCNNSIEEIYKIFDKIIHFGIENFIPIRTNSPKKLPLHLQKLLKYKRQLFKNSHFPQVKIKYDKACSDFDFHLKRYHANYERRILKMPSKTLFKYVKTNLGNKTQAISVIKKNDIVISENEKIADLFYNQFSDIFNNALEAEIIPSNSDDILFDHGLIFLANVKVFDYLDNLPLKVNTSPDDIPFYLIRKCSAALTEPISHILRTSFFTGKVPLIWKTAIIKPIPKIPNNIDIENFRPISLTCSLSKVAEHFILYEMQSFLEKCRPFPDFQHGFLPNKSVTSCLLETVDDFTRAIDQKLNVDVIFYDISKAFDTIDHSRLFAKLLKLGFGGSIMSWLKDFISERTFQVSVNGVASKNSVPLSKGIPQGSLLGPLMYNIYSRDLLDEFTDNCTVKAYADDKKAYIIYNTLPQPNPLQLFTNHLKSWSDKNGLRIANKKCIALYVGNSNTEQAYQIDDLEIAKAVDPVRDLGIHLTPKLNWAPHIQKSCLKANKRWFMFFKFFSTTDPKIYVRLYKIYIRPVLEFGTQVFNSSIKKNCITIEQVQRRATKMIMKRCFKSIAAQNAPYHERLEILGLQTLESRRIINDLVLFDKIDKNKIILNESNKPPVRITNTRGNASKYSYRHARTNIRKDSFFIRVPKIYGKLPLNMIPVSFNSEQFRQKLNKFDIVEFARKTIHS
jgi:hypothetical protein